MAEALVAAGDLDDRLVGRRHLVAAVHTAVHAAAHLAVLAGAGGEREGHDGRCEILEREASRKGFGGTPRPSRGQARAPQICGKKSAHIGPAIR
ncbi:MAG: hypothetical protein U5L08_06305 [Xanthomonadales bacterium]|nr:hypothetical protein [Xanthomonadales bacterium]